MQDATDDVESAAELVLEAALVVVSLWATARPKRATMGMKACILSEVDWIRLNECV
jgi:hypothetical protein